MDTRRRITEYLDLDLRSEHRGGAHDQRQGADRERDAYMSSLGLQVIRIAAADVLADPEAVADGIYRLCEAAAGPSTTQPGG